MRSPSPNAADPISDLSVGRDAFHPSLPSHSSQVTLPDNHLDTLTGDVIPAVVVPSCSACSSSWVYPNNGVTGHDRFSWWCWV